MKIGIVCYPTYGGSGVVATELGKELADKGHIIHFITYDRPVRLQSYHQNIFYHQVSPISYPLFEYLPYESALASKLVEVVRYENLDILHVHYAIPHASSAFMAQQILKSLGYHIPFVTTLHGTDITLVGQSTAYKSVVTFSINSSNGITAVSNYLREETLTYFDIQKEIAVIHNFIDLERFRPNAVSKQFLSPCLFSSDEKIIIHASNFRKVKRVNDVLAIFRAVQSQLPCKLLLIGDGPERSQLESQAREWNIMQHVRFLGNVETINEILPVGDIFLMPSENESFGLAALEAMACGMPVIGAKAGGLPELVEHNKSGFLHDVGDVPAMVESTLELLTNHEKLFAFSKSAYERAGYFSKERIIQQYESYYKQVIQELITI
jgi:L-malate glycosyltransferase